jgi:Photosynthesis system II assembly factor YCF48
MPSDDRDRQLEKALERHLRGSSQDSHCPDTETLAAYHERALSLGEMAHWKQHIAACSRCQETLALVEESNVLRGNEEEKRKMMELAGGRLLAAAVAGRSQNLPMEEALPQVASEPNTIAIQQTSKHSVTLRWVVPVGALAAALLAWVSMRESHQSTLTSTAPIQIAENRPPSPSSVPLAPVPTAKQSLPNRHEEVAIRPRAANELRKQDEAALASKSPEALEKKVTAGNAIGAMETPKVDKLRAEVVSRAKDERAASNSAPAPAAPPEVSNYEAQNIELSPTQNAQAPAAAANQVTNTGRLTGQQNQFSKLKSQPTGTMEVSAARQASQSLSDVLPEGGVIIVAPNDAYSWRVGSGGKIEHSTDNSRTWMLQKSGVTTDLTAGFAISGKVCWVVGKAGTVLLTTDRGKHWKQLPSPTKEDLAGVNAMDEKRASVWSASHKQSFDTNDAGATWTPVGSK